MNADLSDLQQRAEQAMAGLQAVLTERSELKSMVGSQEEDISQLEENVNQLTSELEAASNTIEERQVESDTLAARIEALADEVRHEQEQAETVKAAHQEAEQQHGENLRVAEAQNRKLQDMLETLRHAKIAEGADPALINDSLIAELDALKKSYQEDIRDVAHVLHKLAPMVEG